MTKLEAMREAGQLLKSERIPHYLESRFHAEKGITLLDDVNCIHLTWLLDNALKEAQVSCTFYEKWVDIQGFPDEGGAPLSMEKPAEAEIIRFLNEVNSHAKFGCAFYFDTETHDIVCAGRLQYAVFERAPELFLDMVTGIWAFFNDTGDELDAVAKGRLFAEEAFQRVLDKGWGGVL